MSITYRELEGDDAGSLMKLRLSVMETDPFSFSLTQEEERKANKDGVRSAIERYRASANRLMLGACNGSLIGTIGVERYDNELEAHKVRLWGPYVEAGNRSKGVGSFLLGKAIEFAFSIGGVEIITLETTSKSEKALSLFEAHGFEKTGTQNKALFFSGEYVDIFNMQREK